MFFGFVMFLKARITDKTGRHGGLPLQWGKGIVSPSGDDRGAKKKDRNAGITLPCVAAFKCLCGEQRTPLLRLDFFFHVDELLVSIVEFVLQESEFL